MVGGSAAVGAPVGLVAATCPVIAASLVADAARALVTAVRAVVTGVGGGRRSGCRSGVGRGAGMDVASREFRLHRALFAVGNTRRDNAARAAHNARAARLAAAAVLCKTRDHTVDVAGVHVAFLSLAECWAMLSVALVLVAVACLNDRLCASPGSAAALLGALAIVAPPGCDAVTRAPAPPASFRFLSLSRTGLAAVLRVRGDYQFAEVDARAIT